MKNKIQELQKQPVTEDNDILKLKKKCNLVKQNILTALLQNFVGL